MRLTVFERSTSWKVAGSKAC